MKKIISGLALIALLSCSSELSARTVMEQADTLLSSAKANIASKKYSDALVELGKLEQLSESKQSGARALLKNTAVMTDVANQITIAATGIKNTATATSSNATAAVAAATAKGNAAFNAAKAHGIDIVTQDVLPDYIDISRELKQASKIIKTTLSKGRTTADYQTVLGEILTNLDGISSEVDKSKQDIIAKKSALNQLKYK